MKPVVFYCSDTGTVLSRCGQHTDENVVVKCSAWLCKVSVQISASHDAALGDSARSDRIVQVETRLVVVVIWDS